MMTLHQTGIDLASGSDSTVTWCFLKKKEPDSLLKYKHKIENHRRFGKGRKVVRERWGWEAAEGCMCAWGVGVGGQPLAFITWLLFGVLIFCCQRFCCRTEIASEAFYSMQETSGYCYGRSKTLVLSFWLSASTGSWIFISFVIHLLHCPLTWYGEAIETSYWKYWSKVIYTTFSMM